MADVSVGQPSADASKVETLCALLLEVAGRDTNRIPSARRHVQALDAALPFMTKAQQELARVRIDRLQTRWGVLLPGPPECLENDCIPPEIRVIGWLSLRRNPQRLLNVLHPAACAIQSGITSLTKVADTAYAKETDNVLAIRSMDTFREWLIQLRIARHEGPNVYGPNYLCDWWVSEMDPRGPKTNAYAACLKQLRQPKYRHWYTL